MKSILMLLGALLLSTGNAQAQKKGKSAKTTTPLEQGTVDAAGKRMGKWNFYDNAHQLELTFDYDSSRISFLPPDTARYAMLNGDQWALTAMSRPPRILGSKEYRMMLLAQQLRYPVAALQQRLQGTVVLAYTVGADGHSRDYAVVNGVAGGCTEEVWKAVQQLPDTWIPAIYQGQPVDTRFYLKVEFRITNGSFDLANVHKQAAQAANSQPDSAAATARPPAYVEEVVVTGFSATRTSMSTR